MFLLGLAKATLVRGPRGLDVTVRNQTLTAPGERMVMDLEGRSAIVTGGAGGLGAATVRRLVEIGSRSS
jgi:hypothetical protein